MNTRTASLPLINSLVYLDRAYISGVFEAVTGESPATQITTNQSKKAGAAIPVFSAEVSAQETRSFSLSTLSMLHSVLPELKKEPLLEGQTFAPQMVSKLGWVKGELSVFKVRSTSRSLSTGEEKVHATDAFYLLRSPSAAINLALITTPEYFTSGMGVFLRMQETLLDEMSIPVQALVRVMAAKSHHSQWVAVPFVVVESGA